MRKVAFLSLTLVPIYRFNEKLSSIHIRQENQDGYIDSALNNLFVTLMLGLELKTWEKKGGGGDLKTWKDPCTWMSQTLKVIWNAENKLSTLAGCTAKYGRPAKLTNHREHTN